MFTASNSKDSLLQGLGPLYAHAFLRQYPDVHLGGPAELSGNGFGAAGDLEEGRAATHRCRARDVIMPVAIVRVQNSDLAPVGRCASSWPDCQLCGSRKHAALAADPAGRCQSGLIKTSSRRGTCYTTCSLLQVMSDLQSRLCLCQPSVMCQQNPHCAAACCNPCTPVQLSPCQLLGLTLACQMPCPVIQCLWTNL